MTANDFWRELRELRQVLEAGAPDWNARLRTVLRRTATRRHGLAPEVVTCLRELREDDAATRLGLVPAIDRLLHEATESTEA